jgi:hypothetical protein
MSCMLKAVLGVRCISFVVSPNISVPIRTRSLPKSPENNRPENVTIGSLCSSSDLLSLNSNILVCYPITHSDTPLPMALIDG